MVLNIASIVVFLAITGFWAAANMKGRGAFSALLAMLATLAAGAVAFGLYETSVELIRSFAGTAGTFPRLVEATMYGVALIVPFIIALLIFRLALDLLVPGNIKTPGALDFGAGVVCGAVNGLVTVGIVVLSLGMMRLGPGMGFFDYDPISDDAFVVEESLWAPFDELTVGLYEYLSVSTLGTSTPLAARYPAMHEHAATLRRVVDKDGLGRIALDRDDFTILGGYMLGAADDATVDELASDALFNTREVSPQNLSGEDIIDGSTMLGIAIRFDSGAVDSGQVIFGAGQLRLVVDDGETGGDLDVQAMHPYAVIGRSDETLLEDMPGAAFPYARYIVEDGDWFIGSVGGETSQYFIVEFFIPPGFEPRTLFVKGVPVNVRPSDPDSALELREIGLEAIPPDERQFLQALASQMDLDMDAANVTRDLTLLSGALLRTFGIPTGAGDAADLESAGFDTANAEVVDPEDAGAQINTRLPSRFRFIRSTAGGMIVDDDRQITGGSHTFQREMLTDRDVPRDLRIDVFAETSTTKIVQLELTNDDGSLTPIGEMVAGLSRNAIPQLVTAGGQITQPIGFISDAGETVDIRFTPDRPVRSLSELPDLPTTQRRGTETWLIFRVSRGISIRGIAVNDDDIAMIFEPPLSIPNR